MALEEQPQVVIADFKGTKSNANPHTLQAGEMVVQVNCMARRPGEMVARGGLREQQFDVE